ncbi:MAG: hypothetical protein Roseis2KO_41180 [Roseivirga sp.]
MAKILFNTLVLLCSLTCQFSHGQSIKTPEFPTPERKFYDLLEQDKVTDAQALAGSVKEVEVVSALYDLQGQKTSSYIVRTLLDKQGHITNQKFFEDGEEQESFVPKSRQEADSLDGFLRITVYTEEEGTREYLYKSDLLLKQIYENGTDDTWEQVYTYDSRGRLIEKRTYSYELLLDENNELTTGAKKEIDTEIVAYDGDKLLTKERFSFWDEVINIDKIEYTYNSEGLCTQYNYHYDRYLADNVNWEKSLALQSYSKSDQIEGEETHLSGRFTFNSGGSITTFVLLDMAHNDFTEQYEVSYFFNKMTVKATFQNLGKEAEKSSRRAVYEYTYDRHKNPVNITSYVWESGEKRLDNATTLKITYYQ